MSDNKRITEGIRDAARLITLPNVVRFVGLALIVIGATFYVGWSIVYGTWTDIGLYSFVVPVFVFGILTLMYAQERFPRTK
ncbi:MAG: hypothetical protein QW597_05490 [Thermoplasmataceae archaeon]